MKTLYVIFLFFCILTTTLFAKGGSGTYYIKGKAYNSKKIVLKNKELSVKIGTKTKIIKTDSLGYYEIDVKWVSACPSGRTKEQYIEDNKKLNPEFIIITYQNKEIKLVNNWEKYTSFNPKSKKQVTRKENLHFI